MKKWALLGLFSALMLVIPMAQAQDGIIFEIVTLTNQARQQQGLSPLSLNSALITAAQAHSDDMAKTENLSHQGSNGSEFWERAAAAGYNLSTGGENVLYRFDTSARGAFQQWRESPPHNANMMNGDYREVGIAYSRATSGTYYFTMLLATGSGGTTISNAPAPTQTPASVILVPSNTPIPQVAMPTATPIFSAPTPTRDPLIATIIAPLPTNTFTPLQPVQGTAIAQAGFATPTVNPFRVTPTPSSPPDLRLFISQESFTLMNVSTGFLDLYAVSFESSSGNLGTQRWESEFLTEPLYAFTPNDCLQVWGIGVDALPNKPSECRIRHAWIAVNDQADFWRDADFFNVLNEGVIVGRCPITRTLSTCDIRLSERLADTPSPSVPSSSDSNLVNTETSSGGLRLVLNGTSVTVLNASTQPLNLVGISFESDNGLLGISAWESSSLTRPLSAFPAGDCLQVWAVGGNLEDKAEGCRYRHAWIAVGDGKQFWQNVTTFRVMQGGQLLATCEARVPVCEVSLR